MQMWALNVLTPSPLKPTMTAVLWMLFGDFLSRSTTLWSVQLPWGSILNAPYCAGQRCTNLDLKPPHFRFLANTLAPARPYNCY